MLLTAPLIGSNGVPTQSDTPDETTDIEDISSLILPTVPNGVLLSYYDPN
jgi:hypothetical protein